MRVYFLRHGQATHNPKAEKMREAGCSFEDFLAQMQVDDEFDSRLTAVGVQQAVDKAKTAAVAKACREVELVLSSPLSRAIRTADIVLPPASLPRQPPRIVLEDLREINHFLLNAKRRTRSELQGTFAGWDLSNVEDEEDTLWVEGRDNLESKEATAERGYQALLWSLARDERCVAFAGHGGIFSCIFNNHELIDCDASLRGRMHNCDVRGVDVTVAGAGAARPVLKMVPIVD